MISFYLFELPTWVVITAVVLYVPIVVGFGMLLGRFFALLDPPREANKASDLEGIPYMADWPVRPEDRFRRHP